MPKPSIVNPVAFRDAYLQAVDDVMRFVTPERQQIIATHNRGLMPGHTDLFLYLQASERRYAELVRLLNAHAHHDRGELRALEVGGFLGAYPLTLARLGIPVTLVEHYAYYHGAFDDLAAYLLDAGVEILDADFTKELAEPPSRYTLVTNMAMLEHLADSPKALMDNLAAATDEDGLLVMEVPNIAYYPKRLRALLGRSIHPELSLLYESATPFTGHHREYTCNELIELLRWSGFEAQDVKLFNYSLSLRRGTPFQRLLAFTLHLWPTYLFPDCRELIIAAARPAGRPKGTPTATAGGERGRR
jgi:2-polyprenyl-3-methyl-5-hydroxy-6-metoxy-1,4-benzoquinol methylase